MILREYIRYYAQSLVELKVKSSPWLLSWEKMLHYGEQHDDRRNKSNLPSDAEPSHARIAQLYKPVFIDECKKILNNKVKNDNIREAIKIATYMYAETKFYNIFRALVGSGDYKVPDIKKNEDIPNEMPEVIKVTLKELYKKVNEYVISKQHAADKEMKRHAETE